MMLVLLGNHSTSHLKFLDVLGPASSESVHEANLEQLCGAKLRRRKVPAQRQYPSSVAWMQWVGLTFASWVARACCARCTTALPSPLERGLAGKVLRAMIKLSSTCAAWHLIISEFERCWSGTAYSFASLRYLALSVCQAMCNLAVEEMTALTG